MGTAMSNSAEGAIEKMLCSKARVKSKLPFN
jgi:hypothetical protein